MNDAVVDLLWEEVLEEGVATLGENWWAYHAGSLFHTRKDRKMNTAS